MYSGENLQICFPLRFVYYCKEEVISKAGRFPFMPLPPPIVFVSLSLSIGQKSETVNTISAELMLIAQSESGTKHANFTNE